MTAPRTYVLRAYAADGAEIDVSFTRDRAQCAVLARLMAEFDRRVHDVAVVDRARRHVVEVWTVAS